MKVPQNSNVFAAKHKFFPKIRQKIITRLQSCKFSLKSFPLAPVGFGGDSPSRRYAPRWLVSTHTQRALAWTINLLLRDDHNYKKKHKILYQNASYAHCILPWTPTRCYYCKRIEICTIAFSLLCSCFNTKYKTLK